MILEEQIAFTLSYISTASGSTSFSKFLVFKVRI